MGKLLEAPSLAARYAKGDILMPVLFHFLLQALALCLLLFASSRLSISLAEDVKKRLGGWVKLGYILLALYYIFAAILPILDLEKFVYAAFFDTSPTTFTFGAFFILLAFICVKGLKSFARCADLCLFLFLLPFCALIAMALFESDLTRLLPFFERNFRDISQGFIRTSPHFSDLMLLLPLVAVKPYEKGDGAKILSGYAIGAAFTLLFFAVFFGVFSTLAPREHYAFAKIAQYFPALAIVGRIDLLFVYLLSVALIFYTCLPIFYAARLTATALRVDRTLVSALLSFAFFLFTLFGNRHYNALYAFIGARLSPVFWFFSIFSPIFCLMFTVKHFSKESL